jgi:hypothetical protein
MRLLLLLLRLVTLELPVMFQIVVLPSVTVLVLTASVRIAPVRLEDVAVIVTTAGAPAPCVALSRVPLLPITVASVAAMLAVPPCTAKASAAELTCVPSRVSVFTMPVGAWKRKPKVPGPDVVTLPLVSAIAAPFCRKAPRPPPLLETSTVRPDAFMLLPAPLAMRPVSPPPLL